MTSPMKKDLTGDGVAATPSPVRSGLRLIGSIAIILLAALLVSGATIALVNNGTLDRWIGGAAGPGGEFAAGGRPERPDFDAAAGERPEFGERGGRGGERGERDGLGLQTPAGLLRNLATVGAIVLLVVGAGWVGSRLGARRQAKAPPDYV